MKSKLLFVVFLFLSLSVMGQTIKREKCNACGQYLVNCPYKGNHPKCGTCGMVLTACQYKGNHPKCSTCGKVLTACQYKGNHPKCNTCGKVLTACQYKGNHPKCNTCGKLLTACQYKGNHPKCNTCGKLLTACQYKGDHPKLPSISSPSGYENAHGYVDLGLSVKWATCNIGANAPGEYGSYFAWGETRTKSDYSWSTYFDTNDGGSTFFKYARNKKTTLDLSDDAAHANWGGNWRMPTKAEQDELREKCTWTWTTQNGVKGYKVSSKRNSNSIFLPAAGYRYGSSLGYAGSYGYYWSSSLLTSYSDLAYYLSFSSGKVDWNWNDRYYGRSVRAVCP